MDWIIEKIDWIIKNGFFAHPWLEFCDTSLRILNVRTENQ